MGESEGSATKSERPAIQLRVSDLESLVPDPEKPYYVSVQGHPGLSVRVMPTGAKTWYLRYRHEGKQKVHKLGKWPSMTPDGARKASQVAWGKLHGGTDPQEEKREKIRAAAQAITVKELAERFIKDHVGADVTEVEGRLVVEVILDARGQPVGNKPSTAREHVRLLRKEILPALGRLHVKEVTTGHVADLLFQVRRARPTLSNRVRAVLSKMFAKAEVWGIRDLGTNPARGHDRAPEHKKDRHLNDRELVALGETLKAIEAVSTPSAPRNTDNPAPESVSALAAVRLALLTGMRKAELIGDDYKGIPALPWSEVDLEAGMIHIGPDRHKTGRVAGIRPVHLCAAARALLDGLPHVLGNPYVLPGERKGKALVGLQATWERIRETTSAKIADPKRVDTWKAWLLLTPEEQRKKPMTAPGIMDVTIHDLRRSFASMAARMGYPEFFIAALLGHAAGTVTQGYARLGSDPLHEAAEAIGGRIAGLLDGSIDLEKEALEKKATAGAS